MAIVQLYVDITDLLHWARFLAELPRHTPPAIARALNIYGDEIVHAVVESIAQRTDLEEHAIRMNVYVKEATPDDLVWEMDATAMLPGPQDWARPWDGRNTNQFDNDTLLKVVTQADLTGGDAGVCDVCLDVAQNSPYTQQQIAEMQAKWADYTPPVSVQGTRTNLVHPNCRCITQPWSMDRRVPITFDASGAAPQQLLTMRQLGQRVASELKLEIRTIPI